MKKLATVVAVAGLIGTPAFAADMAVKAPPSPPPAPVYNWTGFYVGGNIGVSLGTFKTDFNATPVTVAATGLGTTCTVALPCTFTTPGFAGRDEVYPGGLIGGGQIGYNWQFSPILVAGLEADFQGADEKEHSTLTQNFSGPLLTTGAKLSGLTATGTTVLDFATKIDWFGTARLRAGYLFGDGTQLAYVTGGLAYGKVEVGGTSIVSGAVTPSVLPLTFSTTHAIGHSHVNTGWVVGIGTEGKLLIPNWTYKIEALYMDLGHLDDTDAEVVGCGEGCRVTATGGQTFTNTHFTDTIIRAGLNYQFH